MKRILFSTTLLVFSLGLSQAAFASSEPDVTLRPTSIDRLLRLSGLKFKLVSKADASKPCLDNRSRDDGDGYLNLVVSEGKSPSRSWLESTRYYPKIELWTSNDNIIAFEKIDQGATDYVRFEVENPSLFDEIACRAFYMGTGVSYANYLCSKIIPERREVPEFNPSLHVHAKTVTSPDSVTSIMSFERHASPSVRTLRLTRRTLEFDGPTLTFSKTQKEISDATENVIQSCSYVRVD